MANGLYAAIAEGGKPLQLENPLNQMAKIYAIKQAQTQNALAEQQQRQMMEEEAAYRTAGTDVNRLQAELMSRGLGRQALAVGAQMQKSQADRIKMLTDRAKLMETEARKIMSNPTLANALERVQAFSQNVGVDPTPVITQLQTLGDNPDAIRQWAAGYALSADKLMPQFKSFTPPGGGVITGTVNQLTGQFMPGQTFAPQPKPPEIEEQEKRIRAAGRTITQVNLPPQEKAFEAELGKGQAERIAKSQAGAQDAANIIDTVNTGRQIMKSGMITGAGAEFFVSLNQVLKQAGIDAGYADAAANSQAFAANMAGNVGRIIKQFGAGTGLSNADREYAEKMAGGKITLDANAINKILDINDRAARNVINAHNKSVKGIKTNIPLEVEIPQPSAAPAAPAKPRASARGGAPAANVSSVREQADAILGRE